MMHRVTMHCGARKFEPATVRHGTGSKYERSVESILAAETVSYRKILAREVGGLFERKAELASGPSEGALRRSFEP